MRVGTLANGGDCQGLNAAIRTVGRAPCERFEDDVVIFGIRDGYRGLMESNHWEMSPRSFSGISTLGGTVLGTSRQPFKEIRDPEGSQSEKVEQMRKNYKKLRLDCIMILGGNGTHKIANLLGREGLNVITLPKTIDNNLWSTEVTFGFSSAVEIVSMVTGFIHDAITSHGWVFIVELIGHKVGWLTLHAGITGGADTVLLPEIPYNIDPTSRALQQRKRSSKQFSVLAMAEGAILDKEAALFKKELKAQRAKMTEPSLFYHLAKEISERIGSGVRVTIPGHFQHDGGPCPYDRVLATRLGTVTAQMIQDCHFGCMIALQNQKIVPIPLEGVIGKLEAVPLGYEMTQPARDIGINFGD